MRPALRNKIHGSVFFHILAAILTTGMVVIIMTGVFFKMISHESEVSPIKKNLHAYAHYIVQDLGSPPSLTRAQELARELYIDIRYESQESAWSTKDDLPAIATAEQQITRHKKRFHHKYMVVAGATGKFLLQPNFKAAKAPVPRAWLLLFFLLLAVVFFCAWLWIRWILRPLVLLNHGVQAISQGHLDHEIPIRRNDDLGRLTKSFNHMTSRIREMMKSKDQMLLDISHEIRSPLTRMKVALELLPNSKPKTSLEDDVNDMERMINKILEAGKTENAHLVPQKTVLFLAFLIRSVLKNYQSQGPRIIFEETTEPGQVWADPEQIRTVLENVLENVVKYSVPGSEPVRIRLEKEENHIMVLVKDQGIGIPQEHLPRIFEPFYRVDPSRAKTTGGFGLGLSICKRIMEAHEGSIEIKNNQGGGIEVILKLPLEK